MSEHGRAATRLISAVTAAVMLVAVIDWLTNSIDPSKFSWDLRYYIDMARRGMAPPLASPFAYRYVTPLLARWISSALQAPVEVGFAVLARLAGAAQLVGVFSFAFWYSKSTRGAWAAMLVTALSLYHLKFLLFDTFRPDHLAYPLILLQVYLAMTRRFWPLLVITLIGCQIREFNAIPLVAAVFATLWEVRQPEQQGSQGAAIRQAVIAALGLSLALVLPRLLIPIAEDFQFVSLTRDGLLRAALAPLILPRDANFIYSVLAYVLPVLMLATPRQLMTGMAPGRLWDRVFLGAYCALVLAFSFLGGTDFYRFSTYLLPAMILVLGRVVERTSRVQLAVVLASLFVFNRIWLPFPDSDVDRYLDFYGASGTRFNMTSVLRIGELIAFLALGFLVSRVGRFRRNSSAPSQ